MATPAPAVVSAPDQVEIVRFRVNTKTNELDVWLNRPWDNLSDPLQDELFRRVPILPSKRQRRRLRKGWTPNFRFAG